MTRRDSRARAAVAAGLRSEHRSWREIMYQLGYRSIGAAQLAVRAHYRRENQQPHEMTRWEQVESVKARQRALGDELATATREHDVDRMINLNKEMARNGDIIAKLTGTYAPQRTEVDVTVGRSPAELLAEAKSQTLAALAERGTAPALPVGLPVIDAEVIA